ncbi:MAG: SET domain-containing protein [Candidatus Shapirobacteria bacterium]|nr:SET domain-containing protein [Candidatus Shapirobacteria bacterium]
MYKISVKVSPSSIEGEGVFTNEDIPKNNIVWIYKSGYDLIMSKEDFKKLPSEEKSRIEKIGYLSPWSNRWVFPPENDAAQFTNHSRKNNLSTVYNKKISEEPYFIANRDIRADEELTNNYYEFDLLIQKTKPDWA